MNGRSELKIPGYRIEKVLGKGGMATVYLATQMSLSRPVALKILDDPETPQFFERFFNEGRCISRLNHSNLVSIYDIGQGEGFYYIAMEYLPGDDLKSRIAQGIQPKAALRIIGQLATCLSFVHNEGIVHRDIKPSNVLFRNDGTPVLTDFGIAKVIQANNDLTVTGTVMGSPHYISPEQAQENQRIDGRADIYSLGVMLFEMLTGRKPFTGKSFAATLMAHIQNPIPELPEQHAHLQSLLNKMLAKHPDERFQSGAELNKFLVRLLKQRAKISREEKAKQLQELAKATPAGPSPAKKKRTKRNTIWPEIIIATVLVSAGVYYFQSLAPEQTAPKLVLQPTEEPSPEQPADPKPAAQAVSTKPAKSKADSVESAPPAGQNEAKTPTSPIAGWLKQAEARLAQNKLSYPRGDSANDFYNKVLAADPGNKQAQAGKRKIADRYAELAERQLARGRNLRASRYVKQGLSIEPEHRQLAAISQRLEQSTPSPTQQSTPQPRQRIFFPGDPELDR